MNSNWDKYILSLREQVNDIVVLRNEPMSAHTSFRIGGPVSVMVQPRNEQEAEIAVQRAVDMGIQPFFMGNGTNLLVSDNGADLLAIQTLNGLKSIQLTGNCCIRAGSGVLLSALASFAQFHGLTGLEFAQGIPGTLGGAVFMNAGAYGGDMAQVVVESEYLDENGRRRKLEGCAEHQFSYRHSAYSERNCMILNVTLRLAQGSPEDIQEKMDDLRRRRRTSQPLEYPSAGSFFKRPENGYAAAMIEECGLKGASVGGAQVSPKHSGFIINTGNATCSDVLKLAAHVEEEVFRKKGVKLEMEVRKLGLE